MARRLCETLASFAFGVRGRGCGESRVRESADRAARRHRAEEGREIGVSRKPRVPRNCGNRIAGKLDDARAGTTHVEHVERRAARAGEDAQVVTCSEALVLAIVERVAARPGRRRQEDPVRVFAARRGELGECLGDGVERGDNVIGPRAHIRQHALLPRETLEHTEGREDRRDDGSVGEDLAHQAQSVEELLERGLANGLAADA